jgi:hypothetical protein
MYKEIRSHQFFSLYGVAKKNGHNLETQALTILFPPPEYP